MLGEHRQVLADLLWARAQKIINDLKQGGGHSVKKNSVEEGTKDTDGDVQMITTSENYQAQRRRYSFTDEQMKVLSSYFLEFKNLEELITRAKNILRKA